MMKTFNCPSCGGALELSHGSVQGIQCPYCNNLVVIAQELQDINDEVNPEAIKIFEQIKSLLQKNQKIEAIKFYRQKTFEGLAESKEIVEQIEDGTRTDLLDKISKTSLQNAMISNDEIFRKVNTLLDANKKIDAIKEVRKHYRIGLAEAKNIVEQIEAGKITSIEKNNINQYIDYKEINKNSSRTTVIIIGVIVLCAILFLLMANMN